MLASRRARALLAALALLLPIACHDTHFELRGGHGEIEVPDDLFTVSVGRFQRGARRGLLGLDLPHRGRRPELDQDRDRHQAPDLLDQHGGRAERLGGGPALAGAAHERRRQDLAAAAHAEGRPGRAPVRGPGGEPAAGHRGGRVGNAAAHRGRRQDLAGQLAHDQRGACPVRVAHRARSGEGAARREGVRRRHAERRLVPPGQPPLLLDHRRVRVPVPHRRRRQELGARQDRVGHRDPADRDGAQRHRPRRRGEAEHHGLRARDRRPAAPQHRDRAARLRAGDQGVRQARRPVPAVRDRRGAHAGGAVGDRGRGHPLGPHPPPRRAAVGLRGVRREGSRVPRPLHELAQGGRSPASRCRSRRTRTCSRCASRTRTRAGSRASAA